MTWVGLLNTLKLDQQRICLRLLACDEGQAGVAQVTIYINKMQQLRVNNILADQTRQVQDGKYKVILCMRLVFNNTAHNKFIKPVLKEVVLQFSERGKLFAQVLR